MSKTSFKSFTWLICVLAISCGCSDQAKPPAAAGGSSATAPPSKSAPTDSKNLADAKVEKKPGASDSAEKTALQPTDFESERPAPTAKPHTPAAQEKSPVKKPVAGTSGKSLKEARPFPEAKLLTSDIVGIAVGHPMQFLESPIGKLLTDVGVENFSVRGTDIVSRQMQMKFHEIERVTVVLEQSLIDTIAAEVGMDVPAPIARRNGVEVIKEAAEPNADDAGAVSGPAQKLQLKNALKQIGLAFHNYHDVNNAFPRADGDGPGQNTGLSWRVHLLPYLDEAPLYNQFNLTEPWDSENNKALISKMPAIFQTPGVDDETKTAFHVFTGEGTPFHGDQGPGIRNFTDGTSNTFLAVLAGADAAEVWTKPGGLEVDLRAPKKALGEIKDETFLALFADGSVRDIPKTIDDTALANLIQPADGNVVDLPVNPTEESPIPIPLSIFTFAKPPKQDEIVKELLPQSMEETCEGEKLYTAPAAAVWFSDARTVVIGSVDSVKKSIAEKHASTNEVSPLIAELQLDADFTAAIDVESQSMLLQQALQANPMMGIISNVGSVGLRVSTTGREGDSLVEVNVIAVEADMAMGLSALANLALSQAKAQAEQIGEFPGESKNDQEIQKIVKQMVTSAAIKVNGERVQFQLPIPSGFERMPELLKPAMISAKSAAQQAQQINNLKQMGLAFHNYHDTFAAFPGAGRMSADKPVGLSWRVYLLPYLDQAPLFNQFHLDEPWDSEHNKTLIDKMPVIFKCPGVDDVGKTSYHVFTGPRAPFADDQSPGIAQFIDGTSNTILAVLAGADTAEIWTKPGGLDFDPDDPIKSLGKLVGERFQVLMADGSVRFEEKTVDPANLRRMIQMNDGEPLR